MDNLYNLIEDTAKKSGYRNITEFCKQTGIPRATMSELKSGRTKKLSAKTAQIIYSTLQISLDTLLGLDSVNITEKDPDQMAEVEVDSELTEIWNAANAEERKAIIDAAKLIMGLRGK